MKEVSYCHVEASETIRPRSQNSVQIIAGFNCVGWYRNTKEAEQSLPDARPDVIFLEVSWPSPNAIRSLELLKGIVKGLPIIVVADSSEEITFLQFLQAGASGYLVKPVSYYSTVSAIRGALQGGTPLSPQVAVHLVKRFQAGNAAFTSSPTRLTQRQREILSLVAQGLLNKEVADALGISTLTVSTQLHKIYRRLNVQNRMEAVNYWRGQNSGLA